MKTLPILPRPNGRVLLFEETLPLPAIISYDCGGFDPVYLEVFTRRAGLAAGGGTPLLRCYRNEGFPAEAYRLRVTKERGIQVEAGDDRGLCWGLTTLAGIIDGSEVPCCDITDVPNLPHRGILLDCVRHFFPVDTVKEFIECISLAKLNTLHWHLSDDQGWRVESKRFPALHENCQHYTQEQIRDIIAFAAARGVEIVPEIDLPGHTTSILAAYPGLSCSELPVKMGTAPGIYAIILCPGKEEVFDLLLPLLEEIAGLFPSKRFHLGGDEAPKGEWKKCPHCQRRMREEQLATEEDLQGWFTARLARHLRSLGKEVICWNESLSAEALAGEIDGLTIQYWAEVHQHRHVQRFWEGGGKVIFSDVMSAYLDQPHGLVPLRQVYAYTPRLPFFRPKTQLPMVGMEACVWTEYIPTPEVLGKKAFPRAYALAEAAWTLPILKNYGDFKQRLVLFLAKNPGLGYTLPAKADPSLPRRYSERIAFSRAMAAAPRPEHSAGLGGKVDPLCKLRWTCFYLF